MGKQKSRQSRVSMGGRQKANLNQEKKRQEKFAAKRGTDREYKWIPNPYNPKTETELFVAEEDARREKAKSSKLPLARMISIMAKLQNQLDEEIKKKKELNQKRK